VGLTSLLLPQCNTLVLVPAGLAGDGFCEDPLSGQRLLLAHEPYLHPSAPTPLREATLLLRPEALTSVWGREVISHLGATPRVCPKPNELQLSLTNLMSTAWLK
jgi:hypothetical protein